MSKTIPSPAAPRVEIDQRSRTARLGLEQLEGRIMPRVRPTRSWLRQGLYQLRQAWGRGRLGPQSASTPRALVQEAEPRVRVPPESALRSTNPPPGGPRLGRTPCRSAPTS
jgi:hypothetical protein